jgi:cell division protein FtsL
MLSKLKENSAKHTDVYNLIFIFFLIIIFSIFGILFTLRNIKYAGLQYEIDQLLKEKQKVFEEVETLRLSVANYSTPKRIEKLYREQLGYFPVHVGNRIVTLELPDVDSESTPGNISSDEIKRPEPQLSDSQKSGQP